MRNNLLTILLFIAPILSFSQAITSNAALSIGSNSTVSQLIPPNPCDTVVYETIDLCPGETIVINGVTYNSAQTVINTYPRANSCDSIQVSTLSYHPWYFFFVNDSICPGDSVYGGGQWHYTPQFFYDTLQTIWGCDSIVGVTLTYKDSTNQFRHVYLCPGEQVFAGGAWQDSAGTYYDTILSPFVCDSFITTQVYNVPIYYTYDTLTICQGDSALLAGLYQKTTGSYIDYLASQYGCDSTVQTFLNVLPVQGVTAFASQSVLCFGDTETLHGEGADVYQWDNAVTDSVPFIPDNTKTYKVVGYDSNNCPDSTTIQVVVNALPPVSAGVDISVCDGQDITLTGSGAQSYQWSDSVVDAVAFYPAVSQAYFVTGTDGNNCQNFDTLFVTVDTIPQFTLGISNDTICAFDEVVLIASGNADFVWTPSSVANDTLVVNPGTTTGYTLVGTDSNTCADTLQAQIWVNPLPTLSLSASTSQLCTGDSVTFTATSNATVLWDNGVVNGVAFAPLYTTTFTATATDSNTCAITDSLIVVVDSLPVVIISASDTAVCPAGQVTLTATGGNIVSWNNGVTNGQPFTPLNNSWYLVTVSDLNNCEQTDSIEITIFDEPLVGGSVSDSVVCFNDSVIFNTNSHPVVNWSNGIVNGQPFVPVSSGSYTVTITDTNNCSAMDTAFVWVNPLPVVGVSTTGNTPCSGDSITLSGTGAQAYSWDNGVVDGMSFVPGNTAWYMVTGTDTNACQNTDSIEIVVNPLPVVGIVASGTVLCEGDSVNLSGTGTAFYSWNNGVVDSQSFVPTMTAWYMVTGTDSNQCSDTDSLQIVVNMLPIIEITAIDTVVCDGDSVVLSGTGGQLYSWNTGIIDGLPFVPNTTAWYEVTGTDANNCQNYDSIEIVVNPLPVVAVAASDSSVCEGTSVTLEGTGAQTYIWSNNVIDGTPFFPAVTGWFMVTGTDANGCDGKDSIEITVNPLPNVQLNAFAQDTFCYDSSATVALPVGAPSGGLYSGIGVTPPDFDMNLAGVGVHVVYYEYTDVNGCTARDSSTIVLEICKGTGPDISVVAEILLYPNPVNQNLTIQVDKLKESFGYSIISIDGKLIWEGNIAANGKFNIDASAWAAGIYFFRVAYHSGVTIQKIVKY